MERKQKFTLLATIIGSGVVILDGTVVNLALPHIARDFDAGFPQLQWIINGYLLSLSALILLGGSLGDILGRKRMYIIGLIGFAVASLLCGLAPSSNWLIAARVVQGVFGALLIPGGLAIINTNFAPQFRGAAIGSWTAWSSITAAIGPFLGGLIVDNVSWRWIFLINIPLIAICAGFAYYAVKESKDPLPRTIDYKGAVLAILGLSGLTFGLIEGPPTSWSTATLTALFGGLVAMVLFVFVEARVKDPMVPLGLFRSRNFTGANLMTFAMYGALSGFLFVFILYLQNTMGYSAVIAGLSALPITLFLMLLSGRAGKLAGKIGPRIFMTVGPIISSVGIFLLAFLRPGDNYWLHILPGVVLFAIGLAVMVAPLTITVMSSVSDTFSGIASGINNAVSRAAGLIVIALLGLLNSGSVYRPAMILCALLTAAAGIISYAMIRNTKPIPK